MQVALGGLPGFATLSVSANTAQLRATGRASLYSHVQAVVGDEAVSGGLANVQAIASVFANTGPGVAELDISSDPTVYFTNVVNGDFAAGGLHPTEANVNLTDYTTAGEAAFDAYVDAGRSATAIKSYAPVFSPNDPTFTIGSFADPQWNAMRAEALYGGGLALDAPPSFFLNQLQAGAYEQFTIDEIRWGLSQGLRVSLIVSPNGDGASFLSDTQAMVSTLTEAGALPTQWVVENYAATLSPTTLNAIGAETTANSATAVALWMAQNAGVSSYTTSSTGALTGSVAKTVSGTVLSTETTSGAVTHVYTGPVTTLGVGPDRLVLTMNEDAWAGDAQYVVTVGGVQQGGVQTITAQSAYGQTQTVTINGDFSSVQPVGITFLNDVYAGATLDRNLYVTGATLDGSAVAGSTLTLLSSGTQSFLAQRLSSPTVIGSGPDTLALSIAGDYALGDYADFTVSVDGSQIGGTYAATASQALGQTQTLDVLGSFSGTAHTVSVNFLNDAWAPGAGNDRNLYVDGATLDGTAVAQSTLSLLSSGAQSFYAASGTVTVAAGATSTIGSGADTLALSLNEDAYAGDALFTVSVDGTQIGGVESTSASHAAGQAGTLDVLGSFGAGAHTVAIDFLNDAYGGPGLDRNLYLNSATLDGKAVGGSTLALLSNGTQSFTASNLATTTIGSGADVLALNVAEDYALGANAQFTVSVDGTQVGGTQTAYASQALGQTQTLDVLGNFSGTAHTVSVNFLNDAWAPGAGNDRNLYVDGATLDGTAVAQSTLSLLSSGAQSFYAASGTVTVAAGATSTIGSGADTLALSLNEDAYAGDALFTVSVDGTQIGGVESTSASHAAGQAGTLDVLGSFGAGAHTVAIDFLNDAYGGPGLDRNLYLNSATLDGKAVGGSTLALLSNGTQSFTASNLATTTIGSGADVLALNVAEDYALGANAQFTVSVDGTQVGGTQTAYASQALGQTQTLDVLGNFSGTAHTVSVNFLNDAWAPGAGNDRNLYVDGATLNGTAVAQSTLSLLSSGAQSFYAASGTVTVAAGATSTIGSGADTLALSLNEDAYAGDALFTVSVDGTQIGGVESTSASHAAGQAGTLDVLGSFGAGAHTVAIDFLNDAYGGPGLDRNLYLNSATLDGKAVGGSTLALLSNGTQSFTASNLATTTIGSGADVLALNVAEDYALGANAQFTVSVDGTQVGGTQTAYASQALGQTQTLDVLGNFSGTAHTVSVNFLNDAWAPGAGNDRNLYVDGATLNGTAVAQSTLSLLSSGAQSFTAETSGSTLVNGVNTVGSGADTLALKLSEDAYQGDAQFVVTVNGTQVGGLQTATALHGSGNETTLDVLGSFSGQVNTVGVDFLNDAYDPQTGADRNLYLDSATINGQTIAGSTLYIGSTGTQTFQAESLSQPVTVGSGSDTLALSMSDDYFQGHAQFTVAIDGQQVGGVQTAMAAHGLNELQTFDVMANLSTSAHSVTVNFLNDAWASGTGNDRNLYVSGATLDGSAVANSSLTLLSGGPQSFTIAARH